MDEALRTSREEVWWALRKLLGRLPCGSTLLLAGDFNTTIPPGGPAGQGMVLRARPSADASEVTDMIHDFRLPANYQPGIP